MNGKWYWPKCHSISLVLPVQITSYYDRSHDAWQSSIFITCESICICTYNPPINFRARSLDKTHHVVQNRTTGISQYTPSDLISVVQFFIAVQNKRQSDLFQVSRFNKITVLKKKFKTYRLAFILTKLCCDYRAL